jgi:transposase
MHRGDLTDEKCERLGPLLPPPKPQIGRTGAPWRALPARCGTWTTGVSRFLRRQKAGIWQRILATLQEQADRAGDLEGETHFGDSSVIRAHQHAAAAKGGTLQLSCSGSDFATTP